MEAKLNKHLIKLHLFLVKVIPMIISLLYLLNIILAYFNIENDIIAIVGGMSILPTIFLYVSSYLFKFCNYHRMFIHYIVINELISWYDYKIGIPINNTMLITLELIITGLFLFIILYLKFKVCKK